MKAVLVISERDNVGTALVPLEAGRRLEVGAASVTTIEPIASGHKVSLCAIAAGAPVVKYGSPIGLASMAIPAGAHVHTHNLSSSRGRGDLDSEPPNAPRLAEPPDDPAGRGTGAMPGPPVSADHPHPAAPDPARTEGAPHRRIAGGGE